MGTSVDSQTRDQSPTMKISLFSFLKMAFGLVLLLSLESCTQTTTATLCMDENGQSFCADKDCNYAPIQEWCPKTCGVCSPNDSTCVDTKEGCKDWKEDCKYHPWRDVCHKTCGVCTPTPGSCVDTEKECPKYKHLCKDYPSFVEVCPKTCGAC